MNVNSERTFQEIGDRVQIFEPCTFIHPEKMILKSDIIISEYSYINGGLGLGIGSHIHIASHSSISGGGYCILEDFSGLSAGVRIITGSADIFGKGLTSPTLPKEFQAVKRSFVHLEKHALLFTNVVVHPGVTIGEGAVVASGSIVTKDIEPWSIYMGIPAKKVGRRNKKKLLENEKKLISKYHVKSSNFTSLRALFK